MSDAELAALATETSRQRLGRRWLAEVRAACIEVARRFDPRIYGVAEHTWTTAEIDDLVQDVIVEQLLRQGQLDYVLDVAQTITDVRRLLRHQVRRALTRRRRLTVVDRLLTRLVALLDGPGYEQVPGRRPARYRPEGSSLAPDEPREESLRRAAAAVRLLPTTAAMGDRAPTVFRTEVLAELAARAFAAATTSLSIDDFGRILRRALTSWLPVVLDLDEDAAQRPAADPADLAGELEETVDLMLAELTDTDRVVLRAKLSGSADSELAAQMGLSRPTVTKRRGEAFASLRAAWEEHASELPSAHTPLLAQLIYLRLDSIEVATDDRQT